MSGKIMLVIGLTGGIASGKSTVSRMLQDAGIPVICADLLAREAVSPGSRGLTKIKELFGPAVIDPQGNLDRLAMAEIVFRDEDKRRALEDIVHPEVRKGMYKLLGQLRSQGASMAVVDVPLLFEKKWQESFDFILVVYVPREVQEQRLIERDRISIQAARARIAAQMSMDEKKKLADRIIDNSGGVAESFVQFQNILRELRQMANEKTCANSRGLARKPSKIQ
jgi:dephospho-CoA kinase